MEMVIWGIPGQSDMALVLGTFLVTPLAGYVVAWAVSVLTDMFL